MRKEVIMFLISCYKVSGLVSKKLVLYYQLDWILVFLSIFLGCIYSLLTSPELMKSQKIDFQRSRKPFLCTSLK